MKYIDLYGSFNGTFWKHTSEQIQYKSVKKLHYEKFAIILES